MVRAQHRPQRLGALFRAGDAHLVEIGSEHIDAVGPGQIEQVVAVEVGDGDPLRGLKEGAGAQVLPDQTAVLERHPVGLRELQIGNALGSLRGQAPGLREPLLIKPGKPEEALPAFGRELRRRAVGTEKLRLVILVKRDQAGQTARHLGMPGERGVLGPGQRQPVFQLERRKAGKGKGDHGGNLKCEVRIHDIKRYPTRLTDS